MSAPIPEPVAWGQLGTLNGRCYLRFSYDRTPYPPPADVARNANLVPLYDADALAAARRQALEDAAQACVSSIRNPPLSFEETEIAGALVRAADAIRALAAQANPPKP